VNTKVSDSALAKLSAGGDQHAFKLLVERYGQGLVHAARSFGIPETDLDDVVQDTFVAAWRALSDYDDSRSFRAWLFSIGLNKMRGLYRFRRVRSFLFGAFDLHTPGFKELEDPRGGPERAVAAKKELATVSQTLRQLPRDQREAIVLTAIVGLSQQETAAALGITIKALEGRLSRGRAKLQKVIS